MSAENNTDTIYDIIVIGAGPAGLACAIEAEKQGLRSLVIDKGSICDSIRRFPNDMTFYSTTELLEIGDVPFACASARPSRVEVLQYYRSVAERLGVRCALYTEVQSVTKHDQVFHVLCDKATYYSGNVVLATGYFDTTNRLGCEGEDLPHVHRYYREAFEYCGMRVVVVGGRNSAVETALDLWRHGAKVHLVHRGEAIAESVKYWQRPDIMNRFKNNQIEATFSSRITKIEVGSLELEDIKSGNRTTVVADFVLPHIGYRPSEQLMRACGIRYDAETLIADIDPQSHETNVAGLYMAGSVLCGAKVWNIFIENGREHALPIVESICRRSAR